MKFDRTQPWRYDIEALISDLPRWRRLRVLMEVDQLRLQRDHHAGNAAFWHRRCVDLLMVERDRSKHIEALEQQVLGEVVR